MNRQSLRTKSARHNGHDLYADIERIKTALSRTSHDIKGRAEDVIANSVDGIKEKSANIQKTVTTYTVKKPYKALGIALLTGIAIGFLLRR